MASSTRAGITNLVQSSTLPRRGKTGTPPAFVWKYGPAYAYSYAGGTYLDNPLHPLYEVSRSRWMAKQEPLWLSFVAVKSNGESSRCVRSWLTRRLKGSVTESLRKNGYGRDGNPLPGSQRNLPLCGTAQFITEKMMVKISPQVLQEQADKAVGEIIRLQKWNRKWPKEGQRPTRENRETRMEGHRGSGEVKEWLNK
jgi:hypothetical protein